MLLLLAHAFKLLVDLLRRLDRVGRSLPWLGSGWCGSRIFFGLVGYGILRANGRRERGFAVAFGIGWRGTAVARGQDKFCWSGGCCMHEEHVAFGAIKKFAEDF